MGECKETLNKTIMQKPQEVLLNYFTNSINFDNSGETSCIYVRVITSML